MRLALPPARRAVVLGFALLLAPAALPGPAAAANVDTYRLSGYEVYFGADHAVFVGAGAGDGGPLDLTGWYTSVYHTLEVVPSGQVTGGDAALERVDGVQIRGDINGGEAVQTSPGYDCTTETHAVTAFLANVTRTDMPGKTGTAVLMATLTHYHAWVFGSCYTYSARIDGTITVIV
jgi:hypothetical protein